MDRRDIESHVSDWYKFDENKMVLIFEDDDENEVFIPAKFEVCNLCNGKGSHVNPSIDAHGITAEEWDRDWDYEDRENYMSGMYDVPCYRCGGKRVEPVPDTERAQPELLKLFEDRAMSAYESAREDEYCRRMGY